MSKFKKEIDDFKQDLLEDIATVKRRLADETFDAVVRNSPVPKGSTAGVEAPFSKGSYVKSHRIGINGNSATPPTRLMAANPAAPMEAAAEKRHLKGIKPFDTVVLHNDIGHAPEVEHIGWAKTRPYEPYRKAFDFIIKRFRKLDGLLGSRSGNRK